MINNKSTKILIFVQRGVFVTCQGVNPADIENIGPLSFFPSPSYPSYYFPWNGQDDYLEPIIAVYFGNPKCMCRFLLIMNFSYQHQFSLV